MNKKGWRIKNGVLPDDLIRELERFLAHDQETRFTDGEAPEPPWVKFPDYHRISMGWRMGPGEDYMKDFCSWFNEQSPDKQSEYEQANPEPKGWLGFYESRKDR